MNALQRARSFGWWSLLVWLTLGLCLEALHGFKVGWYLDVANETRRLLLRLAHVHGTLLALVNLAFAATLRATDANARTLARGGWCLVGAGLLLPLGFLFAALRTYGGDPGYAIVLVPIGGVLAWAGVWIAARSSHDPGR